MNRIIRIGQIVPSSNTTMETEIPAILRDYAATQGGLEFTFHSARMRMKHVRKEELAAMDADSHRCARELADAPIDVAGYACLVAIMAMGLGYHRTSEQNLARIAKEEGRPFPVVTSAGALVDELKAAQVRTVSLLMPYVNDLARVVVGYLEQEGIAVRDYKNFSVSDNQDVGRIPGAKLLDALESLDTRGVDAVVLSACVQMPSLGVLREAGQRLQCPVTSTSMCTARRMLRTLGLQVSADLSEAGGPVPAVAAE